MKREKTQALSQTGVEKIMYFQKKARVADRTVQMQSALQNICNLSKFGIHSIGRVMGKYEAREISYCRGDPLFQEEVSIPAETHGKYLLTKTSHQKLHARYVHSQKKSWRVKKGLGLCVSGYCWMSNMKTRSGKQGAEW